MQRRCDEEAALRHFWLRRDRDSNPGTPLPGSTVFETAPFDRSGISPVYISHFLFHTHTHTLFAEREGFEPPDPCRSTVFKTAAIDRSAISPLQKY
jgi:hypothetical protein